MDDPLRVLVIDDDRFLCQLLRDYLTLHSFDVSFVHTGPDGVALALSNEVDAVILDVMLPGMDGFEVLRRIRDRSDVPVLVLTARGDEPDRISGLNKGADDYLPKTFSHKELLARLNAVIRRSSARVKESYSAGEIVVDSARRIAKLGESRLDLTPVEFDILLALLRAEGRVLSREQLLQEASNRGFDVSERSVDVTGSLAGCQGGGGSGGAIHLVAPTILGNGSLYAQSGFTTSSGLGIIRLSTTTNNYTGSSSPSLIQSALYLPPANSTLPLPSLTITQVNGVAVPATAAGQYLSPDITIAANTAVTVNLAAVNIPLGTVVTLRVTALGTADTTVSCTPLAGTLAASTATCSATFPWTVSIADVRAKW